MKSTGETELPVHKRSICLKCRSSRSHAEIDKVRPECLPCASISRGRLRFAMHWRALTKAVQRRKTHNAADECGLVAELPNHLPANVLTKLLTLMKDLVFSGEIPAKKGYIRFFNVRSSAHCKCPCTIQVVSLPCVWLHRH